jgi:hypothetical protein
MDIPPATQKPDSPNLANGCLALLIRTDSRIIAHAPDHLQTETHTSHATGMATRILKKEGWTHDLPLTACYWPTGRVPASEVETITDHIHTLHTLLYQHQQHSNPKQLHHIILGDFNLHLKNAGQGTPVTIQTTHSIENASNTQFANAINQNKYKALSQLPYTDDGPPHTWYKTDKDDCQSTMVDYVFGNKYTVSHTSKSTILENSRCTLNTDHDAILTTLHMSTDNIIHTNKSLGTRKFNVDLLQEPNIKAQVCTKASSTAAKLQNTIYLTIATNQPSAATADLLLDAYIKHCNNAAAQIEKQNIQAQQTNTTAKRKRLPHDTTSARRRRARTSILHTTAHTQTDDTASRELTRQLQREKSKKSAKSYRDKITKELQDIFNKSQGSPQKTLWKYVQQKQYNKAQNLECALPIYMKHTKGHTLKTQQDSAKVWHDSRRSITHTHANKK